MNLRCMFYGGVCGGWGETVMKTEKTILVKFCGSAVLFLAGAYFLPMWTAWGICDNTAGDGVC